MLIRLRDRAIIATMVYTFVRVGAVSRLLIEDVFIQKRSLWLRLAEKGGKCTEVSCHHNLQAYLTAYMEAADLRQHPKAFVFQTMQREDGATGRSGGCQADG
jgi:integrase